MKASVWKVVALAALVLAGCATHRVNWNARVGNYTLDQAITEYGPPDKRATLSDGRLVAEWISRYSNGGTIAVGTGFYGYPGSGGIIQTTPSYYESKLRLTFNTNGVLTAWVRK
ncbi:MAG TPA: hypothetical protein VF988_17685 [Verrucomicrobiae bacterium]